MNNRVFVFGSNLAGRHGAGSALEAKLNHGAVNGVGVGWRGNAYAIPTKDVQLKRLPLRTIAGHVGVFLTVARASPAFEFDVVAIGCGLAGYSPK